MLYVAIGVFIILVLLMLALVNTMQGDARVVNYTGIVRGGTQQLVKQELAGNPDDALIARLNGIISNLQTGEGPFGLVRLDDAAYNRQLSTQNTAWGNLKDDLIAYRADPTEETRTTLYDDSEAYFTTANDTANAAERYTERLAGIASGLEIAIIAIIVVIAILLALRGVEAMHLAKHNRELSSIAYQDSITGLPNQRKCNEMLARHGIISSKCPTCCMIFDLNNLKVANDLHGHDEGDKLIHGFAEVLKKSTPEQMFVGRLGGDEFLAILDYVRGREIQAFITQLEANVREFDARHETLPLDFAYGYAFSGDGDKQVGSLDRSEKETLRSITDRADERMYAMKTSMKKSRGEKQGRD